MRLPTTEEEAAAKLLREAGWIVIGPTGVKHGCFCDLFSMKPGTEPDGCVIDTNTRSDCVYAKDRLHKESCEYWKPYTEETLAKYWKDIQS